jgi:2-polyprenyl-3-methyl-5-hydroxy-6-metoxy-1,4-benzoquinol methylase
MDRIRHWEDIYQSKIATEVSWYEPVPKQSLDLILSTAIDTRGRIVDVGGGQSFLVDQLLDRGFATVTVLDISRTALEATRERMGSRADKVTWITTDITNTESIGTYDLWHDRAVLHFLTDPIDRRNYVALLQKTLPVGGHFIIGTFAKGGAERCSGLEIQQYDDTSMQELLGREFQPIRSLDYLHTTPSGKVQKFFFGIYRRI